MNGMLDGCTPTLEAAEQGDSMTAPIPDAPGSRQPPPAHGVRIEWQALPEHVHAAVEQRLGSPVVSAASQLSGFSPGVAARIQTADGRRIFLKAVSPVPNPDSPAFH